MTRICFVCLGNICRSPMAEFILKNLDKDKKYQIASRATSYEEQGNDMDRRAKNILDIHNIPYTKHKATRLEKSDKEKFDIFYVMEEYQIERVKSILGEDSNVKTLLEEDIEDPWYTNNFEKVFNQILIGCKKIKKN